MDIPKDYSPHRPLPGQSGNRPRQAEATAPTARDASAVRIGDRRRQPDRRRGQDSNYSGPERRRRRERRQPHLLNARNGQPEALESQAGRTLNIRV